MIVFVHLYNDRSGSPRVLSGVIQSLMVEQECRLFIGSDGHGILDKFSAISYRYWYKRTGNQLATLITYMFSQVFLFFYLLFTLKGSNKDVIYINTLLPFGAAIYGWLTGMRVVYHLHEVSLHPIVFQKFLTYVAKYFASHLIYVSEFHREALPIVGVPYSIIHNAVDESISGFADNYQYAHRRNGFFSVFMLASGRSYKGVKEFIELARQLEFREDIIFKLVLSVDEGNIRLTEEKNGLPKNLEFLDSTVDPAKYYKTASLVLNLTRVDLCKETFGLTILEAMSFGVPVIVPPVGGPAEIVTDGQDGFLVDSRDLITLQKKVLLFADDSNLTTRFSKAAKHTAYKFDRSAFEKKIKYIVNTKLD